MNIFYLSHDPIEAAAFHCDKHCVKMILESAQLLSTAHRVLDGEERATLSASGRKVKRWVHPDSEMDSVLYQATHVNHPSAVWARQSKHHYYWLEKLLSALYNEYSARYKKIHLVEIKLGEALKFCPENIGKSPFVEPPQCMPDYCKVPGNAVQAYKNYYLNEKDFAVWKYSKTPDWYTKE